MNAPTMGYIEPPDIPAGMTVQAWRRANRRPRRVPIVHVRRTTSVPVSVRPLRRWRRVLARVRGGASCDRTGA